MRMIQIIYRLSPWLFIVSSIVFAYPAHKGPTGMCNTRAMLSRPTCMRCIICASDLTWVLALLKKTMSSDIYVDHVTNVNVVVTLLYSLGL